MCLMARVLAFGGGLQLLSVARSLKKAGHYVVLLCFNDRVASKSAFLDVCYNEPACDENGTYGLLSRVIRSEKIDVVIPMEDEQTIFLSRYKLQLERETCVKCAVMDWNILSVVCDKTDFMSFCECHGIPHPRTIPLGEVVAGRAHGLDFPLLIKPSFSSGSRGIVWVENDDELRVKLKDPDILLRKSALQEYIGNADYYYNVMLYRNSHGEIVNHCVMKILRYYPIKGGSSCCCLSIENSALVRVCSNVLDNLNWRGFADFDVLEKSEGEYLVIEINPRVPASLRSAEIAGINFPDMIVSELMGGPVAPCPYVPGAYMRYCGLDMAWFLSSPNRFRISPCWFRFWGSNIYYQEGGWCDWRAFLSSMWVGIKKFLSPSFRESKGGMS